MPLLARHEGTWRGVYRHVAPDLSPIDTHDFRIVVELPDEPGCAYRQTSHYWWPDGRTEDRVFEARFDAGRCRLAWDNGRIAGELWELDDVSLYLSFRFAAPDPMRVCEMIQLSRSGRHRARTWHWFRDDRLCRLTLVDERREA